MGIAPRIPEIAQRDRFIRRVARDRIAYAIYENKQIVVTPSPRYPGHDVALIWSSRREAERWAALLATEPEIVTLAIGALISDVLPTLSQQHKLAGIDWTTDPVDAEIDPADLAARLLMDVLESLTSAIRNVAEVYVLQNASSPALLASPRRPDQLLFPFWTKRDAAEMHIAGAWADMHIEVIPLPGFQSETLPWLEAQSWRLAPEHLDGTSALEIEPARLLACLKAEQPRR